MIKPFIYIALFFTLCCLEVSYGQNQKIGYIDSDVILQHLPEYSGIEQQLNILSENWRREIEEMEQEITDLERDFEAREILFTEEIREQRLNEISRQKDELHRFIEEKFGPRGEFYTRQQELLEPVQRQVFDALERVATRDSYDFVFDKAQDTRFLFTRHEWNLTDEVLLEMGIEIVGN